MASARQHRRAVLERQRYDATLAARRLRESVGQRRCQKQIRAAGAAVLLFRPGVGRLRRHWLVAQAGGTIDILAGTVIEPVVADDAVCPRRAASVDGGVSGPGQRGGVGVMAVLEPRSLVAEAAKASLTEELVPAREIIAAQLVEHQHDSQTHSGRRVLAALVRCESRRLREAAEAQQQSERPAE